jgi:type II secretory pathway component PulF
MALYAYEAFSKEGKRVKGVIDASSAAQVKEHLAQQGLFPIKITPAQEGARHAWWQRLFMRGISLKEKILLTKQFAVLLKSGIPLLQAVELLTQQFEGRMRTILIAIKDDIKEGSSLADALAKYPRVFDNIYVQLVRAGEASGQLEVILERLTEFLERQAATSKKIREAMREPMLQLMVAAGVITMLLIKVVPTMSETFSEQGGTLPWQTQFVLSVSQIFTSYFIVIALALALLIALYKYWRSTPSGALRVDQLKLKLPLIKHITKTSAVVQFCYTLGMLMEGGVHLAESLDIVCSIVDNKVLANVLQQARDKIVKQGKITQYLKQTDMFPPIAIYLIGTGEESGQLDAMLLTVARNYEVELQELLDGLTAALKPILLIVMGVVVGFIIMSVMMPILKMGEFVGV